MSFTDQDRIFLRELGLRSLFHFVKIFGTPVKQGADISAFTHKQLCEFSQDESIRRKGIAMGRRLRKTTVFNRWKSIWCYLRNHEERILIGAETKDIADKSLIWIKQMVEQNEFLRWVYPELTLMDKSYQYRHRWSNTEVEFPRNGIYAEPTLMSIGVGGASQARHFTRIFLTDIIGQEAMDSPKVQEKTLMWVDNVPELLVDDRGEIQFDFTHWKTGDAYYYIQDHYPEYQWRIVPALKCDEKTLEKAGRGHKNIVFIQHPDSEVGETNYPDILDDDGTQVFPTKDYVDMQASPDRERVFWTQHMNMPDMAASLENDFKYEWLKWYHIDRDKSNNDWIVCDDHSEDLFHIGSVRWFGFIDPGGFSERNAKGSRCAAIIVGRPRESRKIFVRWTWTRRILKPSELIKTIFEAQEKYNPISWFCETIAAQNFIYRTLVEEAQKQDVHIRIAPLPKDKEALQDKAKDRRITGTLKGVVSDGEVYLLESMNDLKSELTSYPGLTADLVDCLSWYVVLFGGGGKQKRTSDRNKERYDQWLQSKSELTGY